MKASEIKKLFKSYQRNISKFGKYSEEADKINESLNKLYNKLLLASDRSKVALRHSDMLHDLLTENWNNNEQQRNGAEYAQRI